MSGKRRLHVFFSGTVQGVGFRYTVFGIAGKLPVSGWVRNRSDGRVELEIEGEEADLEKCLESITQSMSGYISKFERSWKSAIEGSISFEIRPTL